QDAELAPGRLDVDAFLECHDLLRSSWKSGSCSGTDRLSRATERRVAASTSVESSTRAARARRAPVDAGCAPDRAESHHGGGSSAEIAQRTAPLRARIGGHGRRTIDRTACGWLVMMPSAPSARSRAASSGSSTVQKSTRRPMLWHL